MDDFDRIAALPEQVAQVAIGADFFADGFAQAQQRLWVVDHEVRVHFECELLDAVLARELRSFFPVGNDFLFPLPVEHLAVFGGPAICYPVRHGFGRGPPGQPENPTITGISRRSASSTVWRKDSASVAACLGSGWIGLPWQLKAPDDVLVFEFLLPGFGFAGVSEKVRYRAVTEFG